MRRICLIAGIVFFALDAAAQSSLIEQKRDARMLLYVGTSSGQAGQGIYSLQLNPADGTLSKPELAVETMNPSFIVLSQKHRLVYACNEVGKFSGKSTGAVASFRAEDRSPRLTLVGQQSSGGQGPAHLSLSADEQWLFVANYGGGSVSSIAVEPDTGELGEIKSTIQHVGKGPDARRQDAPHAHAILPDPSHAFVLATDLGIDRLLVYQFDHGTLVPRPSHDAIITPGAGPRTFVFASGGRIVYLINEMGNTITVLAWNAAGGRLNELQTIGSLPPEVKSNSTGATIAVHPNGRVLYVSNRAEPTGNIAIFDIDGTTGHLAYRSAVETGKTPRHFAVDPSGKWLVCANQGDGTVIVFKIDADGGLTKTSARADVPKPTCVQFATWD